jgi:hypothetical protein
MKVLYRIFRGNNFDSFLKPVKDYFRIPTL